MKQKISVWGENFINFAQKKGYLVKKPTQSQFNRYVNFILSGKGKDGNPQEVKISLKQNSSQKKQNWLWVEIKNSKGKPGWLYGESDFIVFELNDRYLFISRKSLLDHVNSCVNFSLPLVQNSWEGKYKIFQRQGKLDQITQVKLSSILNFKGNYEWVKEWAYLKK